jgi:hypothetical protein
MAATMSRNTVSSAVANVRKRLRRVKLRSSILGHPITCENCGKICVNRRGLGKHSSAIHGHKSAGYVHNENQRD